MFDIIAAREVSEAFTDLDDAGVVEAITAASRRQNMVCARELAAIGELYARRAPEDDTDRANWAIDGYGTLIAEISAALGISRGRARGRLDYAIELRERLPRLAELFARGDIDFRMMSTVVRRSGLILDPELIAKLDVAVGKYADKWMRLSAPKLAERIDMWVTRIDPAARHSRKDPPTDERYVFIEPTDVGVAGIWAQLHAWDGAALDQRLDTLADTVCRDDPRSKDQRRADALAALAAGLDAMRCQCGSPQCPGARRNPGTEVVIRVLADQATLDDAAPAPGYLPGFGPIPATVLREMTDTAKVKPLPIPPDRAEAGYRPSAALAEFIRLRDLTCRFPGCDEPAAACQIDHTMPYPFGPTHPSNLKLLCVFHHLMKTFYTGAGGWADRQLPDGTVIWTAPSGTVYTTTPGGAIFFPVLGSATGKLILPSQPPPASFCRGLMMPRRSRTRSQERHHRIVTERQANEQRLADERRKREAELAANHRPAPF